MGRTKQVKEAFIERRRAELKESGIEHPSTQRIRQEWTNSKERMDDMFRGIRSDKPTAGESNFQDYDDI